MTIHALTRQEIDEYGSAARTSMARRLTATAVEWFADETAAVLGAIAYDERDLDWSAVILGRDDDGIFRTLDRHSGLSDLDDARRLLVETMAQAGSDRVSRRPPH